MDKMDTISGKEDSDNDVPDFDADQNQISMRAHSWMRPTTILIATTTNLIQEPRGEVDGDKASDDDLVLMDNLEKKKKKRMSNKGEVEADTFADASEYEELSNKSREGTKKKRQSLSCRL